MQSATVPTRIRTAQPSAHHGLCLVDGSAIVTRALSHSCCSENTCMRLIARIYRKPDRKSDVRMRNNRVFHRSAWPARAMSGSYVAIRLPDRVASAFSGRFGDLHGKLLAQDTESGFQLVEPGSMPQIEQAIHLGHVAV